MKERHLLHLINSTIGRSLISRAYRLYPAGMERLAAELFTRPVRRRRPVAPEVVGLPAHRFVIDAGVPPLVAWDWGDGPTVLLVHGWNGQAAQMSPFVRALVERGFYVLAFDLPAHGFSYGKQANILHLADAIEAVARKVGPIHAIVAHSLGAAAAGLAMSRGLPVERAVFLAPPAEVNHFAQVFATRLGLPPASVEGVLAQLSEQLGTDVAELNLRHQARKLRVPLLVLHDPTDREVPFAHGQAIAEAWPGARLQLAAGLGHQRLLGDKQVIEDVAAFVADSGAEQRRRSG